MREIPLYGRDHGNVLQEVSTITGDTFVPLRHRGPYPFIPRSPTATLLTISSGEIPSQVFVKTSEEPPVRESRGRRCIGHRRFSHRRGFLNPTVISFQRAGARIQSLSVAVDVFFPHRNLVLPVTRLHRGRFLTLHVARGQSAQQIRIHIVQVSRRGIERPGRRSTRPRLGATSISCLNECLGIPASVLRIDPRRRKNLPLLHPRWCCLGSIGSWP